MRVLSPNKWNFYYYYYVVVVVVCCHRPFLPRTSPLEPTAIPTAQTSFSDCSAFRIVCDVPSTPVFCSESIEYFPGTAFKTFFRPLVAIPMPLIITGIIIHSPFQILRTERGSAISHFLENSRWKFWFKADYVMNEWVCLYTKYLFTLRFTQQFVRVDVPFVVSFPLAARKPK